MAEKIDKIITFSRDKLLPTDFNGGAVVLEDGSEISITESGIQQALREMESPWMKHHNHYEQVLEALMNRVAAARFVL